MYDHSIILVLLTVFASDLREGQTFTAALRSLQESLAAAVRLEDQERADGHIAAAAAAGTRI